VDGNQVEFTLLPDFNNSNQVQAMDVDEDASVKAAAPLQLRRSLQNAQILNKPAVQSVKTNRAAKGKGKLSSKMVVPDVMNYVSNLIL
jgi:hypothetical protein